MFGVIFTNTKGLIVNCKLIQKYCLKSCISRTELFMVRAGQPRSEWWLKGLVSWKFVLILCLQY